MTKNDVMLLEKNAPVQILINGEWVNGRVLNPKANNSQVSYPWESPMYFHAYLTDKSGEREYVITNNEEIRLPEVK